MIGYICCDVDRIKRLLDKDTASPVSKVGVEYGNPYRCPECDADQEEIIFGDDMENVSWCWSCGQKLVWDEVDENN